MSDESGETSAIRAATWVSATVVGQQVTGKAVRDALFLSTFEVASMPVAMVASATVSLAGAFGLASVLSRRSPARVVPFIFALSGLFLVGEWALALTAPRVAALAVYLHMALFGATTISGFWSVFNERFDPHTARRVVARVAAGGTIGGILGGLVAWQGAKVVPVPAMLLVLAVSNGMSILGTRAMRARGPAVSVRGEITVRPSLGLFRRRPYLQALGVLVALGALSSTLLDYALGARAASLGSAPSLLAFFGSLQLVIGVVAFAVSTLGTRAALARLGLAATAAFAPASVLALGAVAIVVPGIVSGAAMRAGEGALRASTFRAAYELFYTPIAAAQKRAVKTLVDVGCDRLGTIVGSGVLLLVVRFFPHEAANAAVVIAMVGSLVAISLGGRLQRGYVASLAESLEKGAIKLESDEVVDATTHRTLAESGVFADRAALLVEIEALRAAGIAGPPSRVPAPTPSFSGTPTQRESVRTRAAPSDRLHAAVGELRSGDAGRVRVALASLRPLPRPLVPFVVSLVADDDVGADVVAALTVVAEANVGALTDAMLDAELPTSVRRRLPRIVAGAGGPRARDALLRGMGAAELEVRYRAARALADLVERTPALRPEEKLVHELAREAIDAAREDGAPRKEVDRRLDHVFSILSLAHGKEPMRVAWRALHGKDVRLRGTALEYLDNVLPGAIATTLRPLLGVTQAPRSSRARNEVLAELLDGSKAVDAVSFDPD